MTGGLVSIEDERSQLLAYSATDGAADELRMLSILGREGPADYLRRLRELGVYDRLRRAPWWRCRPTRRARLAPPAGRRASGRSAQSARRPAGGCSLGTIWIQEGRQPLDPDAGSVLEGAAAVAARLIERARSAPTQEALQIQRLLGLRGGSVDIPSLAAALSLPSTGPGGGDRDRGGRRLIGPAPADRRPGGGGTAARERLRAGVTGGHHRGADLRADPAQPADGPGPVGRRGAGPPDPAGRASTCAPPWPRRWRASTDRAARVEVDRVLDRPGARAGHHPGRVADLGAARRDRRPGRGARGAARSPAAGPDRRRPEPGTAPGRHVEEYLDRFGDVRAAADDCTSTRTRSATGSAGPSRCSA